MTDIVGPPVKLEMRLQFEQSLADGNLETGYKNNEFIINGDWTNSTHKMSTVDDVNP